LGYNEDDSNYPSLYSQPENISLSFDKEKLVCAVKVWKPGAEYFCSK